MIDNPLDLRHGLKVGDRVELLESDPAGAHAYGFAMAGSVGTILGFSLDKADVDFGPGQPVTVHCVSLRRIER